ncbi:MAG TPA: tRNA preQ1(34) S-adenosylmethionine ribosyltransferase-isomerase QueA [Chthonomonadales bacterium]|nr:tRNA preQ1(34) S-adenosylmethionine ribosyltransferase-isomerase QueA [Chthonomonadales bacterium]
MALCGGLFGQNAALQTELFDYELPPDRIAQRPLERGAARLMVLHRSTGEIEHRQFAHLPQYVRPGDTLVLNDTRVSARRVTAARANGLAAETLLCRREGSCGWIALVRPGLKPGARVTLLPPEGAGLPEEACIAAITPDGGRILTFQSNAARERVARWGRAPTPPYVTRPLAPEEEPQYQTVYAARDGSCAAPTAGLHFTEEMLSGLEKLGARRVNLTLHVGVGTFRPMRTESIAEHKMHSEEMEMSVETAARINDTRGRIIAVGTTSVRALETAAGRAAGSAKRDRVQAFVGDTGLFIQPGHHFRAVDALLTNFHLPRSTLLVLICAFAGRENIMKAYAEAVRANYRFYSFGDAMLIL